MQANTCQRGRALPVVLALVAVGVLAFLLLADPLGLGSGGEVRDGAGGGAPDLLGAEGTAERDADTGSTGGTLAGRYGAGDLGAVRLRLLWVGSREPLAGQAVRLLDRRSKEVASMPSDTNGVVSFPQVLPAKGYKLDVQGEGFSPVLVQGVSVHPRATTDLGDLVLGKDVVLRGRVVDGSGRPVPGTSVSVHTIARHLATKGFLVYMTEAAMSSAPPLKQVESDEQGYFAFTALDDGQYSVVARHGGYASKHADDVIVARRRGAGLITLVLGQSGRVVGTVRDPDGKPIAGARVMGVVAGMRMSTNPVRRELTVTDADGSYVIDTVAIGQSYRFGVMADGYAPVFDVGGTTIGAEDLERDFTLEAGGRLEGVVTDEASGKPIEGARVAVYVGPLPFPGRQASPDAKAAADLRRTDAQGRFAFDALSPGQVSSAVVQASGYVSRSFMRFPPPGNPWPDVTSGETTQVEVALKRGGTVRGVVRTKGDRQPVQGAEITAVATGMMAWMSMATGTPTAVSGADGSYVLEGVPTGTYRLMAYADGFSPAGGERGVEVKIPEAGGTVEQTLELISAGVVEGVVKDVEGTPIAGVQIRLRASGGGGGRFGGMGRLRSMLLGGGNPADRSDEEGRFRLEGVASDAMWIVYGESEEYVSGETKPFKVAAGETKAVELQMLPGGAIRGVVFDESGTRLEGVRVQVGRLPDDLARKPRLSAFEVRRVLGSKVYVTDEQGAFFAPNLKAGRTLVRAARDGYITHYKRNVSVKSGETIENYQVPLSKGEVAAGIVRGADGRPLPEAMVGLTSQANPQRWGRGGAQSSGEEDEGEASDDVEPMMFARTTRDGRYEIENVKPGTYSVVVWFAQGHKGWNRDGSAAAIHRGVRIPGDVPEFRLEKQDPGDAAMPAGPGGRRGRR